MRNLAPLAAIVLCSCAITAQSNKKPPATSELQKPQAETQNSVTKATPFPLQLEMRVPFAPTAFASGGRSHLVYELDFTNFGSSPLSLTRIAVLNAGKGAVEPIAAFDAQQIEAMLQPLVGPSGTGAKRLEINGGQSAIVFMWIDFDRGEIIPDVLINHVETSGGNEEGAVITTHHTPLRVLGPPLEGSGWVADDGPGNDEDNHHRRGVLINNGRAIDDRRYAIDWMQIKNGAFFSGDERNVNSFVGYGSPVLAVVDGRVITARDGLPDNVPRHDGFFRTAIPITFDTVEGNCVTLDLGGGQYAYYMHLQPGSVRVRPGDHVRRGDVIARVGASGDARAPHLHFEVTDSPQFAAGEGLPYLIERYRTQGKGGAIENHSHELPLNHDVVDFGEAGSRLP